MRFSATGRHRFLLGTGFAALGALTLTAVFLLATVVHRAIQPSTVIVRCGASGAVTMAEPVSADLPCDEKAVRFFLERFLSAYFEKERGKEPNGLEKMVSPAFTRAAPVSWQPPQWEEDALRAVATVRRVIFSGKPEAERSFQVMGTGEVLFTPRAGLEAADLHEASVPIFFQATLFAAPMSDRIPYGLLVHWIDVRFFENENLLDTFLEKAEVK